MAMAQSDWPRTPDRFPRGAGPGSGTVRPPGRGWGPASGPRSPGARPLGYAASVSMHHEASADTGERFAVGLCGPEDREEQTRLFRSCFKKPIEVESLRWRYDQNPHGQALTALSRPEHLADHDGVSGYACSPRRALSYGDESTLATIGETGDVMTHPQWRKRGLFSELDRRVMDEAARQGWKLVFGLPNRRSAHIFLKLGWDAIGTIRPWTHLLRSDADARRVRFSEGRTASWLVPWQRRTSHRALRRLESQGQAFDVRRLDAFPPEVENLSRTVECDFAFMVRRDARYLDWRFLRAPSRLFRALGVFAPGGAFAGYVVVQLPRRGEPIGFLVDLLACEPDARAAALAGGLRELERAGAAAVQATAIDETWWAQQLRGSGFHPPKPANHLIVILYRHDDQHPLTRAARQVEGWYLTDGDRDDETMG